MSASDSSEHVNLCHWATADVQFWEWCKHRFREASGNVPDNFIAKSQIKKCWEVSVEDLIADKWDKAVSLQWSRRRPTVSFFTNMNVAIVFWGHFPKLGPQSHKDASVDVGGDGTKVSAWVRLFQKKSRRLKNRTPGSLSRLVYQRDTH